MAISASDFSIASNGDLRQAAAFVPGTSTPYTILDLHAWLQDLADNAAPAGDDNVSILGSNPSELAGKRNASRPSALSLLNGINVNDATAQWFKFGSLEQASGGTLYAGIKTIGSIVAGTPMYIVQNNALPNSGTKWWANGHIQTNIKVKSGGSLIAAGVVSVFARKYTDAQRLTFSHFDADLSAGSEQVAAINTTVDAEATLTATQCAAVWAASKISLTYADTTQDLGGGQGSKLHKGTIALANGCTLREAYCALQYACREGSSTTFNGIEGWRYRSLDQARSLGAGYAENLAAPFGSFAGGKWFVAQGWWVTGVLPGESQNYQLTAHDGTIETPPNTIGITAGGLVAGDYVIIARDNGSGGFANDTTLASSATAGATTVALTAAPSDTPTGAGFIRINGNAHTYTGRSGNTISGLSPAVPVGGYAAGLPAFIPFLDKVAASTSESSSSFLYSSGFTVRMRVRNGGASPIIPFETTFSVGSTGGSANAVRAADV